MLQAVDTLAEVQLVASIQDSLALFQYDNARFLGERLVALHNCEANLQLLATCYIHCNQAYRSFHLLKGQSSQRSRYLFAVAAVQMNRYPDAKDALLKMGESEIPFGAAGLYLLGRVCRLTGRTAEAKDYFCRSLRQNPLLWSAFEELCAVGGDDEAAELCSMAVSPIKPSPDAGPSPSSSSQVSAAVRTSQHFAQAPGSAAAPGAGLFGGAGLGFAGDQLAVRTAAQQHQPSGPPGSSAAAGLVPPGMTPTFAMTGPGSSGFGLPSYSFQTPAPQGQAPALFGATPTPAFGSFGAPAGGTGGGFNGGPFGLPPHPPGAPAPAGHASSVSSAGLFRFGVGPGPGTAGPSSMFVTPVPGGPSQQAPAPPQKIQQPSGPGEVPFPGFNTGGLATNAGPQAPAPTTIRPPHLGAPRNGRMMDEGKVRKVSNRLFNDPGSSVRRSQRLAALNSSGGAGHGHASAAQQQAVGPSGAASSVQGQMRSGQPSFIEGDSQNMPDPRNPPPHPSQEQLLPDAKLGVPSALLAALQAQSAGRGGMLGGFGDAALGPGGFGGPQQAAQHSSAPTPMFGPQGHASPEGRVAVLMLLAPLLEACRHLAGFRCPETLASLAKLPMAQYRTPWVACAQGRAHFERADYKKAAQAFEQARQFDRCHVECMDLYSTCLWHMRRHYQLSVLAQELVATDRLAPQTWVAVGNLFSSQKEHEAAVEFFTRAAQVDPTFTYAFTLAGHEHFANEDYDKALGCYRMAVKLDPRHYNALYGLGQIHYRQEKYELAMQHFRLAAMTNPRSSVLACYIGMCAAKLGQVQAALDKLQEAIELDPANPLAHYERANVLASQDRLAEALQAFEALERIASGEPSVAFQMGKLYKRLNNLTAAQQAFELALSYSSAAGSSETAVIKSAIEKLGLNEEEEEEEV